MKRAFTESEVSFIRENHGRMTYPQIGAALGRCPVVVRFKAISSGIASASRRDPNGIRKANMETYDTWRAMVSRCTNPLADNWKYYGGRGITICDRWRNSFAAFLQDMGRRPVGLTLDRIETNGNYENTNCRWASRLAQSRNRRHYKK